MARAGKIIGGKYRLVHPLGVGGMGAVWRAEHVHLKQAVAIKLMDVRGPAADRSVKRFLREGQIAASIRHPNVVYISDFGEDDGHPYLVMELLEGVPLSERLCVGEPMKVSAFLDVTIGTLDGLGTVHAAGIVHRDVKPENIFLVRDPNGDLPKVLDFGLSRGMERGRGHTITREGIVLGTPEYVSPEQARGSKKHDPRSDLYSLGVVMYEALAGRRPVEADNAADLIVALLNMDPVPLEVLRPDLPKDLTAAVMKTLSRSPSDRFASAQEMRDELARVRERLGDESDLRLVKQETSPPPSNPDTSMPPPWAPDADSPPPAAHNAPTLSVDLPHARWRTPSFMAGLATLAFGLGVFFIYLASGGKDSQAAASDGLKTQPLPASTTPVIPPAPVEPQPARSPKPKVEELRPSEVIVQLEEVPQGAKVWVDERQVVGPTITLPFSSAAHDISVTAKGRRPWSVSHVADENGVYIVNMPRRQVARPKPRRRTTPRTRPPGKRSGKDLVRKLDF